MENRRQLLQAALVAVAAPTFARGQARAQVHVVSRQPLPAPFGGQEAVTIEVVYPPGASSAVHRHPGFVLGYVIEGQFRFGVNGEPERVLQAGETFYEPPDAVHDVSANPSSDRETKLLAIIIAEPNQELTTPL